ncbi:MAG: hypothetical protein AB1896_20345 [Thermodesulfobacteriota bacterium]
MENVCQKCGRDLAPGELRYRVTIDCTSMWDGYIEEPDGDVDEEIERLIEVLSRQSPREMQQDVAVTISLVLCRGCRNKLVREWEPADRVVH